MLYRNQKVALIVPCFNEELAIIDVINGFKKAMPELSVYVFDNNSTDKTREVSENAGSLVITVSLRGKGNVVRRMFADVEADIYVMVDGDATYEASAVKKLVDKLLDDRLDMVVGFRKIEQEGSGAEYRRGHQFGNLLLTQSVINIFGGSFTDMLSGYRVFTRRYVKSFPAISHGFEIETELTVHALELRMPFGEVETKYGARQEGSVSKLSTYSDGWRILKTIVKLFISERPYAFFGITAIFFAAGAIILSAPVLIEYWHTGLVPRMPTALLSASLMLSALLSFVCGLILDNVTRGRHETKRLAYLSIPPPTIAD
jgi:glycosyltransferase involved in cell wall biosynthesis